MPAYAGMTEYLAFAMRVHLRHGPKNGTLYGLLRDPAGSRFMAISHQPPARRLCGDMSDQRKQAVEKREYPPVYEKLVPIALGIIAAIIVVLLLIVLAVVLGLFPGSGSL